MKLFWKFGIFGKLFEIFIFWNFCNFFRNFEFLQFFRKLCDFTKLLNFLPFHRHHLQIGPKQLNQPNYLSKCWNRFLVGQRHRNKLFGLSLRFRPKDFGNLRVKFLREFFKGVLSEFWLVNFWGKFLSEFLKGLLEWVVKFNLIKVFWWSW